ncbi:MAG: CRISPR-associated endonuclease Cas1 [Parcubacteria group bacterium Gr01-1014_33]|nr:MAG: CRISPR-associated endonuclease Cas1 [Parcubacteria group bacterium Gr01-1014_33]
MKTIDNRFYGMTNKKMLSLPDFKEKQMLFAHAEWGTKSFLRFANDNIVFSKDGKIISRASCHKVFAVFIVGDIAITSRLLQQAATHAISLFFMRNNFEVFAPFSARAEGNYLLRIKQYSLSEDKELSISRLLVKNKAENQMRLLKSRNKAGDWETYWQNAVLRIAGAKDNQELLGIEGELSRRFFSEYFKDMDWRRRMPRVKPDVPNFLLDMGYTYLFNVVDALLRLHGFDTYKGVYHKLFFQRKSLACDLVEPFRCIIDHALLKAHNLKQVDGDDFSVAEKKVALSYDKQRKYATIFLETIMDHKEDIFSFVHGFYRFIMDSKNEFPEFAIHIE